VNTGEVFGYELDPEVPVWAAALIVLVAYSIAVSPFRAMQKWFERSAQPGAYAFWNAVVSLVAVAVIFWFASNHIPEIREFVQRVPHLFRDFMLVIRDVMTKEG
jgi:hypothetical protein